IVPKMSFEKRIERLNKISAREPKSTEIAVCALAPAPIWAFGKVIIFCPLLVSASARGIGRCSPQRFHCLRHGLCGFGEFASAALQFCPQPQCGGGVAFTQLQPMRCTLVIPVVVCDPTEILRILDAAKVRLFDNVEPARATIHRRGF